MIEACSVHSKTMLTYDFLPYSSHFLMKKPVSFLFNIFRKMSASYFLYVICLKSKFRNNFGKNKDQFFLQVRHLS